MERWSGRVAVVTGASAGIGAAVALELARRGMRVAGLARRTHVIQEMGASLDGGPGQLHAVACDLTKEEDILTAFDWVKSNLGGVDVLVNNAGLLYVEPLSGGDKDNWRRMLDVNVLALSICTREALRSMKDRKVDGHIVHVNSVAGHYVASIPGYGIYTATKHAVTALTEGLRLELVNSGSKVKVTSLSPGLVHTEMVAGFEDVKGLQPEDVAASVIFTLSTLPHVQVHELMLRAVPEIQPKIELKSNIPPEFERRSPPEKPREMTRESPPEEPPNHQPESPPQHQEEPPPQSPPEDKPADPPEVPEPQQQPENQPEIPLETTDQQPPVEVPEPEKEMRAEVPIEDPPEKQPEAPQPEP